MAETKNTIHSKFRNNAGFVVGVVGAIFSWVITEYYLEVGNLYITAVAFFLSIVFMREEFWGAFGAFLAGLALDLYLSEGRLDEALVIGGIILFFSVLQVVAFAWSKIGSGAWRTQTRIAVHTTFALMGLVVGYSLNVRYCELGGLEWPVQSTVARWAIFSLCPFSERIALISNPLLREAMPQGTLNVVIYFVSGAIRDILLLPFTWGALFAAVSGLQFNIRRPLRIFSHAARILYGGGLYAIPFILALFALYYFDIFPHWRELLSSFLIGVIIFLLAFRMGQKAEKVPKSYSR